MKLSFSIQSKASGNAKKPALNFDDAKPPPPSISGKQFVTEFDPSKPTTDQPPSLIIPPKPNEWRPHKRMKNPDLPPLQDGDVSDQPLQFEVHTDSSVDPSSDSISYGLNLRQSGAADGREGTDSQNPNPSDDVMLRRLREDLVNLPEDNGFDEFTDMPVEGFGAALLKGYGWVEGRGIGRNVKEDAKVVEYTKRTGKEGLGFTGELPVNLANGSRNDQGRRVDASNGKRIDRNDNVDIPDASRKIGGEADRSERKDEGRGRGILDVGDGVRIVRGRDMGLKGRVAKVKDDGESVVVRLSRSEEEVRVRAKDVALLGSAEEETCLRKLKELKIKERENEKEKRGRGRDGESSKRESRRESKDVEMKDGIKETRRGREESNRSDTVSWLTSHIRVRIISKEFKGGRFYLKKGQVVDVVGPTTCDISMDDGRKLIQGVEQELLETALPKRGGPVLVLYGKHKGVYGSLVERDTEKETGVVQDADSRELVDVRLEQIAEYVGDPSYIGY